MLQRKDQIEAQLANLEKCVNKPRACTTADHRDRQIYNLETSYLEDTYNVGTALKVLFLDVVSDSILAHKSRAGTL